MNLKFLGHACFVLEQAGVNILTDPYNDSVGYRLPLEPADYVTVSHEHFDHNSVSDVPGQPTVVKGPGVHDLGGIKATGVATKHDDQGGTKRGPNTAFCFEFGVPPATMRVCHLGDLGHQLSAEQLEAIGKVDVLLVPVGGTYTLDPRAAALVVAAVRPRVVVPMHYKTAALSFPLRPVADFLSQMARSPSQQVGGWSVEFRPEDVRALSRSVRPKILVLDYRR